MAGSKNVTLAQLQEFAERADKRLDELEKNSGGTIIYDGKTIGAVEAANGANVIVKNCTVNGTLTSKAGSKISVSGSTLKGSPALVANGGTIHLCGGNTVTSTVEFVESNGGKIIS